MSYAHTRTDIDTSYIHTITHLFKCDHNTSIKIKCEAFNTHSTSTEVQQGTLLLKQTVLSAKELKVLFMFNPRFLILMKRDTRQNQISDSFFTFPLIVYVCDRTAQISTA